MDCRTVCRCFRPSPTARFTPRMETERLSCHPPCSAATGLTSFPAENTGRTLTSVRISLALLSHYDTDTPAQRWSSNILCPRVCQQQNIGTCRKNHLSPRPQRGPSQGPWMRILSPRGPGPKPISLRDGHLQVRQSHPGGEGPGATSLLPISCKKNCTRDQNLARPRHKETPPGRNRSHDP
jgi:hypothetical protein